MQAPVTLKGLYVISKRSGGGGGVGGGGVGLEQCLKRVVKFSKSVEMEGSFFKFRSRPNIELL